MNRLQDVEEENEMMNQIIAFAKAFRNGDIVVFYFSGHSSQSNRNNYLILTNDTNIDTEQDIEIFGANLEEIIDRLTENKPDCLFILIFDCCRPYSINGESTNNRKFYYS